MFLLLIILMFFRTVLKISIHDDQVCKCGSLKWLNSSFFYSFIDYPLQKGECPSLLDLCIWKICEMRSVMRIFDGGNLEHKILQRTGCMNYETTTWEVVKPDVYERLVSYQFNRLVSISL
ncbi:hypothetical protein QN277_009048 [Acacia crassicarpa]|uniref:Uncharacterized protein n=1 Tax=Acacia crassicarpa TaxID=499986 RepID=A0AAE1ISP6_9FABA|nr:hypothetical protein QN277_009048 [Acacia crassicarpa]